MMQKSIPSMLAALVCALLLTGCVTRPSSSADSARGELQERQAGFLAAMNSKDAARLAAFFAEDAVMHVANMPVVKGRNAIETFYANIFRFLSESRPTPEALQLAGSADLAYAYGSVTNVFDGPQGRSEFPGKYLLVWQKQTGAWLVAAYGITSDRSEARRQ